MSLTFQNYYKLVVFFIRWLFKQSIEQNRFSKYSNGTFPAISRPHKKHLEITFPWTFSILLSAANALWESTNFINKIIKEEETNLFSIAQINKPILLSHLFLLDMILLFLLFFLFTLNLPLSTFFFSELLFSQSVQRNLRSIVIVLIRVFSSKFLQSVPRQFTWSATIRSLLVCVF